MRAATRMKRTGQDWTAKERKLKMRMRKEEKRRKKKGIRRAGAARGTKAANRQYNE